MIDDCTAIQRDERTKVEDSEIFSKDIKTLKKTAKKME
jgi:hypothetical protein